ncbi:hypothetical protein WAK64_06765 [Bacillus spongiae]|uniref:EamA domain-containing protein n=1 Tax=Bacillus spongiae TaxID=2683610 RepID=A0ABU8HBS0_9BACI
MNFIIGGIFIVWGLLVKLSSIKNAYTKEKAVIGASGYLELEFLFSFFHKLSNKSRNIVKSGIGMMFVIVGIISL